VHPGGVVVGEGDGQEALALRAVLGDAAAEGVAAVPLGVVEAVALELARGELAAEGSRSRATG